MTVGVTDQGPRSRGRNTKLFRYFGDRPFAKPVHLEGLSRSFRQFGQCLVRLHEALTRINYSFRRGVRIGNVDCLFTIERDGLDQGFASLVIDREIACRSVKIGTWIVVFSRLPWWLRDHAHEGILCQIGRDLRIDTAALQ